MMRLSMRTEMFAMMRFRYRSPHMVREEEALCSFSADSSFAFLPHDHSLVASYISTEVEDGASFASSG